MINFQLCYWITHWAHSFTYLYVKNITCKKIIEIRSDLEIRWAEDYIQTWGVAVERQSIWVVRGCGDNWVKFHFSLGCILPSIKVADAPHKISGNFVRALDPKWLLLWDYLDQSYWLDPFLNKFKMVTNLWLFNCQILKLWSSNESFSLTEQSFKVMDCKITIDT